MFRSALSSEVVEEAREDGDVAAVVEEEYVCYGIGGVLFACLRGYTSLDMAAADRKSVV